MNKQGPQVPSVSVVLLTYKHEEYIEESIKSILNQKVEFPVEILIAVDPSEDRTHEICLDYESKYPGKITVLLNDPSNFLIVRGRRVGRYNFLNALYKAKNKYIAICDGDDYWTNSEKLQRQVDILEKYPDCIACHHWQNYAYPNEGGTYRVEPAPTENQGYCKEEVATVKDVFANNIRLKSRTILYRNLYKPLPNWFNEVAFGDVALSMILGQLGNFRFIDEPMAVYRQTGKGVSKHGHGRDDFTLIHFIDWIDLWEKGDLFSRGEFRAEALKTILGFYKRILKHYGYKTKVFKQCAFNCIYKSNYPLHLRVRLFINLIGLYFSTRKKKDKQ